MQSKMVDTGVQIRFNDDLLFCANDKIEKSRDEKRSVKKRHLEIQPAVAKNQKVSGLCLANINNRERGGTKRAKTHGE